MEHQFRGQLEKFVGVERPPTLALATLEAAEFVATRVQWEFSENGHPTQFDRADGYLICLQRLDLPDQPYWVDQRPAPLRAMQRGQFLLLDLRAQHSSLVPSDVDCVSFFVSRDVLLRFQEENDLPRSGELHAPHGAAHSDPVIRHLGEALLPAFEQPRLATQLYVSHVGDALLARLTANHGTGPATIAGPQGGLSTWQERRAKEMMLAHLDGRVGLEALAAACRLSRSHFARAFKVSTGMSPLRWLAVQRIERAKLLLLNTDLPLEQIAAACGFADASHLGRAFSGEIGMPPGTWRRIVRS